MNIVVFPKKSARVANSAGPRAFARCARILLALLACGFAGAAGATLLPPTGEMTFAPSTIHVGTQNPSQLTIKLTNPNPQQIDGVAFSDAYPNGVLNLNPN